MSGSRSPKVSGLESSLAKAGETPRLAAIEGPTLAISMPWPTLARNCRRVRVVMIVSPKDGEVLAIIGPDTLTAERYTVFLARLKARAAFFHEENEQRKTQKRAGNHRHQDQRKPQTAMRSLGVAVEGPDYLQYTAHVTFFPVLLGAVRQVVVALQAGSLHAPSGRIAQHRPTLEFLESIIGFGRILPKTGQRIPFEFVL